MKRTKNIKQQSSRKTEATEVNAIMEQLDELYINVHKRKTNINHFTPLFGSDNEEGTKQRMKPKNPIIVLSEYEEGRKTKSDKNKGNEEDEDEH